MTSKDTSRKEEPSEEPSRYRWIDLVLSHTNELDLRDRVLAQVNASLSVFPHLSRGLEPLVRFVRNTRMPSSFLVYLDRDRDALPSLIPRLSNGWLTIQTVSIGFA